jgi:hypothetical protein
MHNLLEIFILERNTAINASISVLVLRAMAFQLLNGIV